MLEYKKIENLMGEDIVWCLKIDSVCPNPEKTCQECEDDNEVWLYPSVDIL